MRTHSPTAPQKQYRRLCATTAVTLLLGLLLTIPPCALPQAHASRDNVIIMHSDDDGAPEEALTIPEANATPRAEQSAPEKQPYYRLIVREEKRLERAHETARDLYSTARNETKREEYLQLLKGIELRTQILRDDPKIYFQRFGKPGE